MTATVTIEFNVSETIPMFHLDFFPAVFISTAIEKTTARKLYQNKGTAYYIHHTTFVVLATGKAHMTPNAWTFFLIYLTNKDTCVKGSSIMYMPLLGSPLFSVFIIKLELVVIHKWRQDLNKKILHWRIILKILG